MDLSGVRVLDLTRYLPGPYATQVLADCGAEVINVESPDGDPARGMEPRTDENGVGRLFDAVNRGKRSAVLDLKTGSGREAFLRLAEDADVVIEGFRPGVVDRLGVGYEDVRERNPEVVYCSLSGYGQDGPWADRVGHDLNYVATAGLLDATRRDDGEAPRIPGVPVADVAGGLYAAFGVVSALLSRELGNASGEYLDVSMTDAVASLSQTLASSALAGDDPRPGDTPLTGRDPWYDVYETREARSPSDGSSSAERSSANRSSGQNPREDGDSHETADGRYVTLAALEPQFWDAFCEAVGRPDLRDAHGTRDPAERAALRAELADLFAGRTQDEWEATLGDVDAAFAPVRTPREALDHPQIRARGLVGGGEDAPPRVGLPFVDAADERAGPPPGLGEHTADVLREAGYGDDDLVALRADGAIPDE